MKHLADFEGDGELLLDGEPFLRVHYVLHYHQEIGPDPNAHDTIGPAIAVGTLTCESPQETFEFIVSSCDIPQLELRLADGSSVRVRSLNKAGDVVLTFLGP